MADKWGGISVMSDSLYDALHTRESMEVELRRRIEPLLRLLEISATRDCITNCRCKFCEQREKELDTWRK